MSAKQPLPEPYDAKLPVEGIDYVIENGFWIFTPDYLKRRGYCCQNACRNCPYLEVNSVSNSLDTLPMQGLLE